MLGDGKFSVASWIVFTILIFVVLSLGFWGGYAVWSVLGAIGYKYGWWWAVGIVIGLISVPLGAAASSEYEYRQGERFRWDVAKRRKEHGL